jgi:DNA polymerase IIIc chi subunit
MYKVKRVPYAVRHKDMKERSAKQSPVIITRKNTRIIWNKIGFGINLSHRPPIGSEERKRNI